MKNIIFCCLVGILVGLYSVCFSAENKDESTLPELLLVTPESEQQRAYLGLSTQPGEQFKISDIDADILIIELFSMYCPYCQKEAPLVNELYRLMKKGENKGLTIKIIGLGASNSQFEVEHFASTYGVNFPLFPDKDMSMYKALGGEGTPGFVGYRLKDSSPPVNVVRNSGGFYSAEEFLQDVIRNSGL
jgi:peroxiredoxin